MEVLLRENYKWIPAHFNPETGRICREDGTSINLIEIVSIRNDERKNYVVCKNCGEIIRDTEESLETHFHKSTNSDACMKCPSMAVRRGNELSREYELNADGSYKEVVKLHCRLSCANGRFGGPDINSEDARNRCKYAKCRTSGTKAISDIFTEYPEVFDNVATVDALDEKVWALECRTPDGNFVYRAKKKFRLYAIVNSMGIIDHFNYRCYSDYSDFVYSTKYEKVFWLLCGSYSAVNTGVSSGRVTEIVNTIAKIYKE